jgi:hypothetical protein
MKYEVNFLPEPFQKTFTQNSKRMVVETQQTAELTFLKDDGSKKESVSYGYITPEEIQILVGDYKDLNLNYCYISDSDFSSLNLKSITAQEAFFNVNVDFSKTDFIGKADFSKATFGGDANFEKALFEDEAVFQGVEFCSEADFIWTTFDRSSIFRDCTFNDYARFLNGTFNGMVDFSQTVFISDANFSQSTFKGRVDFYNIECFKDAFFYAVKFINAATFQNVYVNNKIAFDFARFDSFTGFNFSKCKDLELDDCTFKKSCNITNETVFASLSLNNCKSFGQFSIPFNNDLKKAIINSKISDNYTLSYKDLAQEFNFLKVNYNRNGEYEY